MRNENVKDSAQNNESYSLKLSLDVEQLIGPHNLSLSEKNHIPKDICNLEIERLYSLAYIVFLENQITQDGYKILKQALCWGEQIVMLVEKIKENIAKKEKENIRLADRIRIKMTNVQKKLQKKEEKVKKNIKEKMNTKYIMFYFMTKQMKR